MSQGELTNVASGDAEIHLNPDQGKAGNENEWISIRLTEDSRQQVAWVDSSNAYTGEPHFVNHTGAWTNLESL